jgi:hypothetical protein
MIRRRSIDCPGREKKEEGDLLKVRSLSSKWYPWETRSYLNYNAEKYSGHWGR